MTLDEARARQTELDAARQAMRDAVARYNEALTAFSLVPLSFTPLDLREEAS